MQNTLIACAIAAFGAMLQPAAASENAAIESAYHIEGQYRLDLWTGISGPLKDRFGIGGNVDLKVDIDADKAWGWKGGRLFAHVLANHGNHPNRQHGAAQGMDNIEVSVNTIRLFQAWAEQSFLDDRAAVLAGLLDLNSEFQVTESSALLIHPTFGTGSDLGQTGRNGPSIFPVSSLALRGVWRFDPSLSVRAALFDGVPGDPAHPHGTHIRLGHGDGTLGITELAYTHKENEYGVNKLTVGAWRYTMRFDDHLDVDANGDPIRRPNRGWYALGERTLWKFNADGSRGMDGFLRLGWASSAVNQMDKALGAGVLVRGLFESRPQDRLSFGIAAEHNSHKWRDAKRAAGEPGPAAEVSYELTYRAVVNEWFAVQPDVQWLRNHGEAVVKDAVVVGVRFDLTF